MSESERESRIDLDECGIRDNVMIYVSATDKKEGREEEEDEFKIHPLSVAWAWVEFKLLFGFLRSGDMVFKGNFGLADNNEEMSVEDKPIGEGFVCNCKN